MVKPFAELLEGDPFMIISRGKSRTVVSVVAAFLFSELILVLFGLHLFSLTLGQSSEGDSERRG